MLIPFRRERARTLRALALAATPATAAPQGTTRRCADEQPSPTPCDSHANALPPMLPPPHPTPMQHLVLLSLHRRGGSTSGPRRVSRTRSPLKQAARLACITRSQSASLPISHVFRSGSRSTAGPQRVGASRPRLRVLPGCRDAEAGPSPSSVRALRPPP